MSMIKSLVIEKYIGDNKINDDMKIALVHEYEKYQLYKFDSCYSIMKKALDCRSVKKFTEYLDQLEDELNKEQKNGSFV